MPEDIEDCALYYAIGLASFLINPISVGWVAFALRSTFGITTLHIIKSLYHVRGIVLNSQNDLS